MKHFIDFINAKDLANNELFNILECGIEEAKILQFMAKNLLEKDKSYHNEIAVKAALEGAFRCKGAALVGHLDAIKSLLNLEYIVLAESRLSRARASEPILLELLGAEISLSRHFLRMLENGKPVFEVPEIAAYASDLDYINDEFLRVSALQELAFLRKAHHIDLKKPTKAYARALKNLAEINDCIKKRLKITQKEPKIRTMLRDLSEEEKAVFFAVLKEEYHGENEKMREFERLLELISEDECAKIHNKYIFDERGALLECGLLDYFEDFSFGFDRNERSNRIFFVPSAVLGEILSADNPKKSPKNIRLDVSLKNQDIFELVSTKESLQNIILPQKTKERLDLLTAQLDTKVVERLKKWGIKQNKGIDARIIFYGAPGTGKTTTAHALANALKKPILSLDCSKILSMWVGESEKNVRKIFDTYKNITREIKKDAILLLDEADQFLSQRSTSAPSSADKMHNQMQNIFLEQIEKFDGILIATTNLLDNIDQAFSRRFNYKIEFSKPDCAERRAIWEKMLPKNAAFAPNFSLDSLAAYETTGAQIKLIVKNTAYKVAVRKDATFSTEDFIAEIKKELDSSFDGGKSLGFLS